MQREHPPLRPATHAIGVDGCAAGWVVCVVPISEGAPSFAQATCRVIEKLAPLLAEFDRAVIALDMPIGLPDRPERGGRECDRLARALLPAGRKSSVFSPPTGDALHAGMAELARSGSRKLARLAASRANQALAPAGVQAQIGAQCFGLFPKLAEVDALMTPRLQQRVVEAHPEIIFDLLACGKPVARKKEAAGVAQRTRLLRAAGFSNIASVVAATKAQGVVTDDILDAFACAVTALRVQADTAETLPSTRVNARGLTSAIWR